MISYSVCVPEYIGVLQASVGKFAKRCEYKSEQRVLAVLSFFYFFSSRFINALAKQCRVAQVYSECTQKYNKSSYLFINHQNKFFFQKRQNTLKF